MIEGVEHMQVKFGQRVPGGNIRFVDPSDADLNAGTNYEGLISVRIALLMQGFDLVREGVDTRRYVLIDQRVSGGRCGPGSGRSARGGPVQRDVYYNNGNTEKCTRNLDLSPHDAKRSPVRSPRPSGSRARFCSLY
jgi:hypothetical protein